jgi:TfoX/Sxy family transcriptional regulator of competence genes
MAYDEHLAERVRALVSDAGTDTDAITEILMFGGWCVTIRGHMAAGVLGDDLIVRVGPDAYEASLARAGAREFDFTGRPSRGIVVVDGTTVRTKATLSRWVTRGLDFAGSLPPKPPRRRRRPRSTRER